MNKNQSEPKHFGENEEIEHDEKVTFNTGISDEPHNAVVV